MSRYIDEEALIEEIERCSYETWSKGVNRAWWAQAVKVKDNIVQCIKRQPAADVEQVRHGEWKVQEYKKANRKFIVCSVCDSVIDSDYTHINENEFDFCPYCGAKMGEFPEGHNDPVGPKGVNGDVAAAVHAVKEKFALHFGTYTGKDTVKVADVFALLEKICREVEETDFDTF